MTSLAADDPSVTEFEATVEAVDGSTVVLDETYFYAESGGQPADRGLLAGHEVQDVQRVDGAVHHELTNVPDLAVGDTVSGAVDPQFRTYCRRAHTASHALYGAGRKLLDDLGYGGFDIGEEKVRIDFETTTDVDDETLVELERLTNRAVWESREVTWRELPREEALADDDIAFNTKTEEGLTGQDTVRVVEIDGWDRAACGGTHVRNTRDIGPVTVLSRSNPGEGLTRVEFAVGPVGIDRRATEARAARAAATTLDTRPTELGEAVAELTETADTLEARVQDLRDQVIEARLSELEDATVTRDGHEWLAGSVPTDDANALADFAQRFVEEHAHVVALVGEQGNYLAVATDGSVEAGEVVDDVTAQFGGGGGGSPTVAQAGGLDADPADIVAFLRGE
jgi:alanyl-tRNA synthetase